MPTGSEIAEYVMVTTMSELMAQFNGRPYEEMTDLDRTALAKILLRSTRSLDAVNLLSEFFKTTFKSAQYVSSQRDIEFAQLIANGLTFDNELAFATLVIGCDYDIVMHLISAYISRSDIHLKIMMNMCQHNYIMLSSLFMATVCKLRPEIGAIKALYKEDSPICQKAMLLSLIMTILKFASADTFDVISVLITLEFIVVGKHDVILVNNVPLSEAFPTGMSGALDHAKHCILSAHAKMTM